LLPSLKGFGVRWYSQRMAKTEATITSLHEKLEERQANTAAQKQRWVDAGMQEYELEQELEELEHQGTVSSLPSLSVHRRWPTRKRTSGGGFRKSP
jgi:CelD/BcsL family acetyltransferase involved in cellulose biosynthesis